ncbi:MAG: STAS domain-containing protein [Planctomycetota bacterium]|jgi:anti-anti-sigma factor
MPESDSRLNVGVIGQTVLVELTETKILNEIAIAQIGERLNAIVAQSDKPRLVIDFGQVSQMSSSALGMFITVHKRICEKKGELRLCNIQPTIREVFVITRLNEIFEICPTRDEALESLN